MVCLSSMKLPSQTSEPDIMLYIFQRGYGGAHYVMRKEGSWTPPRGTPHMSTKRRSATAAAEGRKLYSCTLCEKSFANSSNLNRHMQVHTGNYSYYCEICRKGFNETNAFKAHMNKHEGRSFPCQFCTNRYNSERSMKDHMRAAHGKF